jgi:hypothetical protein
MWSHRRPCARRGAALAVLVGLAWCTGALAQSPPPASSSPSFKVLADQVASFFPVIQTEVVEATGPRVVLASGRSEGVQVGVELAAFREGRELYHPTTKKLLGRTEDHLGRVIVTEVFENYAVARLVEGQALQPGDKARVTAGKIRLTLVSLTASRSRQVEAATFELVQELERTGRFQVGLGDPVAAWLAQERIANEDFMKGRGVRQAAQKFSLPRLLAAHFTTVEGKPYVELRLFSAAQEEPLLQTALFVPASVRVRPDQQFSSATAPGEVKLERRSLLSRLLSGDWEPNRYSASAASIPLRALATFPFPVVSMDVSVAPADKVPRIALTDGQKVFLYRLQGQTLAPEWTFSKAMLGKVLSVQLADVDGDGVLDVVVNRQDYKAGMLSYILTTRAGKAAMLADDIALLLLALDEQGDGVKRTLLGHPQDNLNFFTKGAGTRYVLRNKDLVAAGRLAVPDSLRLTGATLASIAGKGNDRVLAFVDEHSRLRISAGSQDLWRSQTPVGGGGLAKAQLQIPMLRTIVDKFFNMEFSPVAADLDGDGIDELIVPINEEEAGRMAVVFRGPAGYRMQIVSTGFEGMVTGLGIVPTDGGPSIVAAVLRRTGLLKDSGDTQLIMTLPE